jgi:glycosyltransferase involved in cell wall biosynthesis
LGWIWASGEAEPVNRASKPEQKTGLQTRGTGDGLRNDMPKIKVCHVNTRFLRAGGAKNTLFTVAGLDKSRYEIDLVVGRDVFRPQVDAVDGVNLIVVPSMTRNIHPLQDLKTLVALFRLFRQRRYQLVHTHLAKAGMLGRLAAKMAHVPIIVHSLHGSTFYDGQSLVARGSYILLERLAGRMTDCFIAVGDDLRNRYIAQNIGRPSQYVVIHSGMDLGRFVAAGDLTQQEVEAKKADLGIEAGDAVIGAVSSLEPRKGHIYLIEAAKEVVSQHPKVKFLLAGEGFYREELERAVKREGVGGHFVFAGYREDVPEVMATFDILALTSLWEGLPQVLVQAAAVGRPIVTFDVEGAREVVKDGVNGFVVPSRDVDRLAEKLGNLLSAPSLAKDMGMRGRNFIDDSWTVEMMVRQTDDLYQRLLQEKGIAPRHAASEG